MIFHPWDPSTKNQPTRRLRHTDKIPTNEPRTGGDQPNASPWWNTLPEIVHIAFVNRPCNLDEKA